MPEEWMCRNPEPAKIKCKPSEKGDQNGLSRVRTDSSCLGNVDSTDTIQFPCRVACLRQPTGLEMQRDDSFSLQGTSHRGILTSQKTWLPLAQNGTVPAKVCFLKDSI